MLELNKISKTYISNAERLHVLKSINLQIPRGQFLAVVGPSGSGKSTLLGLMAGLDRPTTGTIKIDDRDLTLLSEEELATIRNLKVGFVFQSFQLIQSFTAVENVAVPLELRHDPKALAKSRFLLNELGLDDRRNHYPGQLSGGEQQRVAIARAVIANPSIVFADEPTGNLDSQNGKIVLETLEQVARDSGRTLILVTHDLGIAGRADRIIELKDGAIVADTTLRVSEISQAEMRAYAPKKALRPKTSLKGLLHKRKLAKTQSTNQPVIAKPQRITLKKALKNAQKISKSTTGK